MRRRDFVRIGGTIGIGALAGCSGNGGDETPDSAETDSTADNGEGSPETGDGTEPAEETNETGDGTDGQTDDSTTEAGGTGGQRLDQYEDDEPEMEARYEEERQDRILLNWMEFENLEEQIPQENYSLEEFPTLEILEYDNGGGNDAYNPENETVYLGWGEKDGKTALDVAVIYEWGDSIEDSELHAEVSTNHTEAEADMEGILRDVVEGYNEVSDKMEEEYRELL